jgi:hypothetical protein
MMGMSADPISEPVRRRGDIPEVLQLTVMVAVIEAANVDNARQLFSY